MSHAEVLTKEVLTELYTDQGLSTRQVAEKLGIPHHNTVLYYLKKYGLPRDLNRLGRKLNKTSHNVSRKSQREYSDILTKDRLIELYTEQGLSVGSIGFLLNINRTTVHNYLQYYGVATRKPRDLASILTKNFLLEEYSVKKKSITTIAQELECQHSSVLKYLDRYNIRRRESCFSRKYNLLDLDRIVNLQEPVVAYWLGFIAADGCVSHSKSKSNSGMDRLRVALSDRDLKHLQKLKRDLNLNCKITTYTVQKTQKSYSTVLVTQPGLLEAFSKWNIIPNKTKSFMFPDHMLEPLKRHFIRGYFDGDGCVSIDKKGHGNVSICGASKQFIYYLQNIFSKNNIKTYIYETSPNFYLISFSRCSLLKVYNYLYKDLGESTFLTRKKEKFYITIRNRQLKGLT